MENNKKILVVEDDNATQSFMEFLIAEWGYIYVPAMSGEQAVAKMRRLTTAAAGEMV